MGLLVHSGTCAAFSVLFMAFGLALPMAAQMIEFKVSNSPVITITQEIDWGIKDVKFGSPTASAYNTTNTVDQATVSGAVSQWRPKYAK